MRRKITLLSTGGRERSEMTLERYLILDVVYFRDLYRDFGGLYLAKITLHQH